MNYVDKGASFGDRCRAWLALQDEMDAAIEEVSLKIDRELGEHPAPPEILTASLVATDGTTHMPPESPIYFIDRLWTVSDLAALIQRRGFAYSSNTTEQNRVTSAFEVKPLADDVLAKAVEMLQVALDYENANKSYMSACREIEDAANDRYSHVFYDGLALIAEPVETLADLAEKVRIIRRLQLLTGCTSEDIDAALVAMFDNILKLGRLHA